MIENNNDLTNLENEKLTQDEVQKQNQSSDWSSGVNVDDVAELLGDVVEKVGDFISNIDLSI